MRFAQTIVENGAVRGLPCEGLITSPFGATDIAAHSQGHSGVDIGAPSGRAILAPAAAVVRDVFAIGVGDDSWESVFGNSVILKHDEGFVTLYAHMVQPPSVYEGQRVEAGDLLGYVGMTGTATGPHLHWGMAPASNGYLQRNGLGGLLDPLSFAGPEAVAADNRDVRAVDVGLIRIQLETAGRALRDAHVIAGGDGDLIRGG